MSIGILEIVLLVLVTLATVVGVMVTKRKWLAVVPVYFLIAMVMSPPDPFSMLIIGTANCAVFAWAFTYFSGEGSRRAGI